MKAILHNKYVLYLVFLIAFIDFLYFGYIGDTTSVAIFILVGVLITFFNKNMIIVLSLAIIITNVLKYGAVSQNIMEGFVEGNTSDEGAEGDEEDQPENEPAETTEPTETPKPTETFGQDKEVVYTSVEDQKITEQDKMMLAHEQLLKRMNKYKPLLDTLQGLTKNIAIVKGLSNSATELKESEKLKEKDKEKDKEKEEEDE
jgi:hypothetical protein